MKRLAWSLRAVAVAATAWLVAVLLAPMLPAWPAALVYGVCSLVCHQLPERSLYWGSVQFAVCARCTGVYLGGATMMIAASMVDPARLHALKLQVRPMLIAGAAPTLVTVIAEWLGLWAPAHAVRLVTGLPLGASVMATVAVAITLHYEPWLSRPERPRLPRRPS